MVKDYKITTTVNKEAYLKLRGNLMLREVAFNIWLDSKIGEELKWQNSKKYILVPQEPVAGKSVKNPAPISRESVLSQTPEKVEKISADSRESLVKQSGELSSEDYV